jgi:integrase
MAGQIIRRGDQTWLIRIYLGTDPETGKRRYFNHTVHGTKKKAQQYLTQKLGEKDRGTFVEPARMSVDAYLDRWLEDSARPRLRRRTFEDYKWLLKAYVRPVLGSSRLDQVQPLDVQSLYNKMRERGLSGRTVHVTHNVVRLALKQAVRWKMLSQNPTEGVDLPRWEKREMLALSPEEVVRFRTAASSDRWGVLFDLALVTGMRPGEILGLRWCDVNLVTGSLMVRQTLARTGKAWRFEPPKTEKSRRTIPLPRPVVRTLAAHKARQAEIRLRFGTEYQDHDLVFAGARGAPLDSRSLVRRHLKPILLRADLPEALRLYDLRHTCASLLLAAGENAKVVSERLGHAGVTITLDTYGHVMPGMQEQATARLEELIFGLPS